MSEPEITINPQTLWCGKHLKPFKAHWPNGYMSASMCLFNQVVESEACIEACDGDVSKINNYMAEFGPFCCQFEAILPDLFLLADPSISQPEFHRILKTYSFPPPGGWRE